MDDQPKYVPAATKHTVPRAVADRLAEEIGIAMAHANGRWDEWGERAENVRDWIEEALAEYRKAVGG